MALWEHFVQNTHPGTIQLDDTATGRAYMFELARLRDRSSHLNYAVYHDRYQRAGDGWKFTERRYEILYLDTSPLACSAPPHPGRRTERPGRVNGWYRWSRQPCISAGLRFSGPVTWRDVSARRWRTRSLGVGAGEQVCAAVRYGITHLGRRGCMGS